MRLRQFRGEHEAAIDMRELKAGLRPIRSSAERILIRSKQLREQLQPVRGKRTDPATR